LDSVDNHGNGDPDVPLTRSWLRRNDKMKRRRRPRSRPFCSRRRQETDGSANRTGVQLSRYLRRRNAYGGQVVSYDIAPASRTTLIAFLSAGSGRGLSA